MINMIYCTTPTAVSSLRDFAERAHMSTELLPFYVLLTLFIFIVLFFFSCLFYINWREYYYSDATVTEHHTSILTHSTQL